MFVVVKAVAATILIAEIAGGFFLGLESLVLMSMNVTGALFWSVEGITAIAVLFGCVLYFRRALAYEKSVSVPVRD